MKNNWIYIQKDEFLHWMKEISMTHQIVTDEFQEKVTFSIVTNSRNLEVLRKVEHYYGTSYYKNVEVVGGVE
ncbi:hypothetical protein NVP1084O_013 [Vibrio phage 1.084.O._10N.261.49.F5]|nr:hypothetical protein NVP1084O_013 [Vibrio phage 1.084.O._10N.261.49.F5]